MGVKRSHKTARAAGHKTARAAGHKTVRPASKTVKGKFCRCIKAVTRRVKKESVAIPICVRSVLGSRGKTIHSFKCTGRGKFMKVQGLRDVASSS